MRLLESQKKTDVYINKIDILKAERKNRSAALQQKIFKQFSFLNAKGVKKNLVDIFKDTPGEIPPAGAGECAAPKLLQYAYQNQLKPLAMAEFWWGESPKSEIRKHAHFYPACKSKCKSILAHMLEGLKVDKNPLLENRAKNREIEIVYEDDMLLVINKPAGLLSVPGKDIQDSVFLRMQQKMPKASGPLVVHRLDMSTSGLMLIGKPPYRPQLKLKVYLYGYFGKIRSSRKLEKEWKPE